MDLLQVATSFEFFSLDFFYSFRYWELTNIYVIQVHDELVLEVDPSVIKETALLLRISMENAASLLGNYILLALHFDLPSESTYIFYLFLVPLHVKLKVGRTWGSLEPFQNAQYNNEI